MSFISPILYECEKYLNLNGYETGVDIREYISKCSTSTKYYLYSYNVI